MSGVRVTSPGHFIDEKVVPSSVYWISVLKGTSSLVPSGDSARPLFPSKELSAATVHDAPSDEDKSLPSEQLSQILFLKITALKVYPDPSSVSESIEVRSEDVIKCKADELQAAKIYLLLKKAMELMIALLYPVFRDDQDTKSEEKYT